MPAQSGSGEGPLPSCTWLPPLRHMAESKVVLWPLLVRVLILPWGLHAHSLITSQRPHLQIHRIGIRVPTWELWRDSNMRPITKHFQTCWKKSQKKVLGHDCLLHCGVFKSVYHKQDLEIRGHKQAAATGHNCPLTASTMDTG